MSKQLVKTNSKKKLVNSKRELVKTNSKRELVKTNNGRQINKIIFENINEDYAWGKYGEFNVIIMNENGYINATKLCADAVTKAGGKKELFNWKQNTSSNELMQEVAASLGISRDALFIVKTGGSITEIRGTYVHPKLIPHIASWASPKFAVKVSDIVNEYFIKEAIKEKDRQLGIKNDKIDELNEKVDKLLVKNDKILKKNNKMDNRIKRLLIKNDELYDSRILMTIMLGVNTENSR